MRIQPKAMHTSIQNQFLKALGTHATLPSWLRRLSKPLCLPQLQPLLHSNWMHTFNSELLRTVLQLVR
jgi:hypothetical protein